MITVYGASDDLIEVDGDIREEFGYNDYDRGDKGDLLAFSDGTILRVRHSDSGIWRITPVAAGTADLTIVQAPEDDDRNYTDRGHARRRRPLGCPRHRARPGEGGGGWLS